MSLQIFKLMFYVIVSSWGLRPPQSVTGFPFLLQSTLAHSFISSSNLSPAFYSKPQHQVREPVSPPRSRTTTLRDTHNTPRGEISVDSLSSCSSSYGSRQKRMQGADSTPHWTHQTFARRKGKVPQSSACDSLKDGQHDQIIT